MYYSNFHKDDAIECKPVLFLFFNNQMYKNDILTQFLLVTDDMKVRRR